MAELENIDMPAGPPMARGAGKTRREWSKGIGTSFGGETHRVEGKAREKPRHFMRYEYCVLFASIADPMATGHANSGGASGLDEGQVSPIVFAANNPNWLEPR
jgi:hypothetical protein